MGIYIKGIKKPKYCSECTIGECRVRLPKGDINYNVHPQCPLIEVKEPHGDLIDVKPFIEDYKNCEKHNCIDCMAAISRISCKAFIDKLNDAPIVIEAEE